MTEMKWIALFWLTENVTVMLLEAISVVLVQRNPSGSTSFVLCHISPFSVQ